jgi:hypothetical protein
MGCHRLNDEMDINVFRFKKIHVFQGTAFPDKE